MLRCVLSAPLIIILGGCAPSNGPTASISGAELALPIPDGYCELSESHPVDREMIQAMRRVNVNNNHVLSVFAACDDLQQFRVVGGPIDHTGTYFAPKSADGRHFSMPRTTFVQQIARQFERADVLAEADRQAKKTVREHDSNVTLEEKVTKLMHADETAAYLGTLQMWDYGGGRTQVTSVVTALTTVQGRVVSLNLFAPYKNNSSTRVLLAESQENIRRLLDANGD